MSESPQDSVVTMVAVGEDGTPAILLFVPDGLLATTKNTSVHCDLRRCGLNATVQLFPVADMSAGFAAARSVAERLNCRSILPQDVAPSSDSKH